MDFATAFIASLGNGAVTSLSALIHENIYLITFILFAASIPFFAKKKKLLAVFLGLFILLVATAFLKTYYAEPRPCDPSLPDSIASKVACPLPPDYSFPSGHVAVTAFFMAATAGTAIFAPFYLLGLFTAFSRVYLGVHFITDVFAGLILGIVCYAVSEKITEAVFK